MNFITRNLGWILLSLFFIFMLFLISSNTTQEGIKKPVQTGTLSTSTGEQNLENLIEKLGTEVTSSGLTDLPKPEKISLFERLFGTKWNHKEEEKGLTASGKVLSSTGKLVTEVKVTTPVKEQTTIVVKDGTKTGSQNLVKNTLPLPSRTPVPSIKTPSNPLAQTEVLETQTISAIGKKYQVAVASLKLNNMSFTQVLWYLSAGDIVEQKTQENINGCFEIKVLQAKNIKNIGKEGYVCKKYLKDVQENTPDEIVSLPGTPVQIPSVDISQYPQTQIGDIITVKQTAQLILREYTDLAAGDQIDQMTNIDKYGCIIAHVYASAYATSRDMVGRICLKDIY